MEAAHDLFDKGFAGVSLLTERCDGHVSRLAYLFDEIVAGVTRVVLDARDVLPLLRWREELKAVRLGESIEPVRCGEGFVFGRRHLMTARTCAIENATTQVPAGLRILWELCGGLRSIGRDSARYFELHRFCFFMNGFKLEKG